ncbi:MAG TPA: WD40 repeat domain-containing protein [Gemmataceae bacterium]|jgi:WD40 repeat protein
MPPHGRLLLTCLLLAFTPPAWSETPRTDHYGDPLPKGVRFRLGSVRMRHEGIMHNLAWMPDGKTLASAAWHDDTIRFWRATDGKEFRRINGRGPICGLAFTRDGHLLAWGESGIGVHIAESATGKEVRLLEETTHLSLAGNVNFSPDGKLLAVSCLSGSRTQIYAVDSGEKLLEFEGAEKHYGEVVFSPDSKSILVGGDDGVSCLDVAKGAEVRKLPTKGNSAFFLAFSPDGKRLAGATGGGKEMIWVWNWPEGKLLHRLQCGDACIRSIAFSPDGKTLATAGDKGHGLRLWDVASGKERYRLPAHEDQINAVAFSPDGSLLASGGDNRCISLWDMRPAKEPRLLTGGYRRFTAVVPTPDGKGLTTSERSGELVLWDARDGREVRRLEPWDRCAANLTISSNGKWLAACAASGALGLWDLPTGRCHPTPREVPATIGCAAFSPDGEAVALGDEKDVIHVCATRNGARIRKIFPRLPNERFQAGARTGVRALAWSPDGRTLAIHYWESGMAVYDPFRGREQFSLAGPLSALAFSADGRLLAVAGLHRIHMYETATGQEVQRTPNLHSWILSVAFAPDGRTLAFGGGTSVVLHCYNLYRSLHSPGEADFSIRLWDIAENKELPRLIGHAQQVESLVFSPDGARLVSQGVDSVVLNWDMAALAPRPAGHGEALSAAHLAELWTDLASRDAVSGQKAVGQLLRSPEAALSLLAGKLAPAPAPPRQRIAALLADLDSDEFARREKATQELQHIGETAMPALRKALKEKLTLEARKRMESILDIVDGRAMTPEQLRTVRGVQVLESIGTPQARRLLEGLAGGAAEAKLTEEAKASLQRLARRSAKP